MARVGVAVPWILLAIFIVAVGGIPFALAMIGFSVIGLSEFFRMTRRYRPMVLVALAAAAGMVVAAYYGSQFQIVLVAVATFPAMFALALARDSREGVTRSMAITLFAIGWIAVPFAHAVLLRELPVHGGALMIDVLVGTFLTDTAAYAGGACSGAAAWPRDCRRTRPWRAWPSGSWGEPSASGSPASTRTGCRALTH